MLFVITPHDVIVAIVIVALVLIVTIVGGRRWWRQYRCPHTRVRENMQCHAICTSCGKDLGFIGTYREKMSTNPYTIQRKDVD